MKKATLTSFQAQQNGESNASLKLPSGEHVYIHVGIGVTGVRNVRVMKIGIFNLPTKVVWHAALVPSQSGIVPEGRMIEVDLTKIHSLEAMVGYVALFTSIEQMQSVAHNPGAFFVEDEVIQSFMTLTEDMRQ